MVPTFCVVQSPPPLGKANVNAGDLPLTGDGGGEPKSEPSSISLLLFSSSIGMMLYVVDIFFSSVSKGGRVIKLGWIRRTAPFTELRRSRSGLYERSR